MESPTPWDHKHQTKGDFNLLSLLDPATLIWIRRTILHCHCITVSINLYVYLCPCTCISLSMYHCIDVTITIHVRPLPLGVLNLDLTSKIPQLLLKLNGCCRSILILVYNHRWGSFLFLNTLHIPSDPIRNPLKSLLEPSTLGGFNIDFPSDSSFHSLIVNASGWSLLEVSMPIIAA
jgi:hypothetical protein